MKLDHKAITLFFLEEQIRRRKEPMDLTDTVKDWLVNTILDLQNKEHLDGLPEGFIETRNWYKISLNVIAEYNQKDTIESNDYSLRHFSAYLSDDEKELNQIKEDYIKDKILQKLSKKEELFNE